MPLDCQVGSGLGCATRSIHFGTDPCRDPPTMSPMIPSISRFGHSKMWFSTLSNGSTPRIWSPVFPFLLVFVAFWGSLLQQRYIYIYLLGSSSSSLPRRDLPRRGLDLLLDLYPGQRAGRLARCFRLSRERESSPSKFQPCTICFFQVLLNVELGLMNLSYSPPCNQPKVY